MRFLAVVTSLSLFIRPIASQQIWDIWQTTWDRSQLFSSLAPYPPLNFSNPTATGSADIVINDASTYQSVWGFGGSLTDSSALLLSKLKTKHSANYWALMASLFNVTDGANSAGLSYIRVPIGATDFSASAYSLDDVAGDTSFANFNINNIPSYVFSTLADIKSINSQTKIHLCPWSPPGWMKTTNSMFAGSLQSQYVSIYPNYLLKALQGFQSKGFTAYAISIQNEPQNADSTYPTTLIDAPTEATIGTALRSLMNANGFSGTLLIGYEHNWDDASEYPVQLFEDTSAFDGVAFHCYAGDVSQQDDFHAQYPKAAIYFTECSGTIGTDWWSDLKWYMDNLWIGAITNNAHAGLMWNIALDGNGNPKLPGTDSCGGPGCRGIVQVNSDGSYSLNQEWYTMAQANRAVAPRDVGGPWGKRIGVSIGGSLNWALVVGAYMTGRVNPSDWLRYSIVVLNWYDNDNGNWDPTPVQTTIEFRGMQATYTFPVGITTLWWYAPANSSVSGDFASENMYAQDSAGGSQHVFGPQL